MKKQNDSSLKAAVKNNKEKAAAKEKAVKADAVLSHQWKAVKQAKIDTLLGHGGVYCLRKGDVTGNILSEGKGKGASKRLVSIFAGSAGLCFLDGAFIEKRMQVAGYQIDTSKIKSVRFFGTNENAVAYVRKHGRANIGATKHGEKFTHVLSVEQHYSIATDGKRLLRLEEWKCTDGAAKFCYSFGKAKK